MPWKKKRTSGDSFSGSGYRGSGASREQDRVREFRGKRLGEKTEEAAVGELSEVLVSFGVEAGLV